MSTHHHVNLSLMPQNFNDPYCLLHFAQSLNIQLVIPSLIAVGPSLGLKDAELRTPFYNSYWYNVSIDHSPASQFFGKPFPFLSDHLTTVSPPYLQGFQSCLFGYCLKVTFTLWNLYNKNWLQLNWCYFYQYVTFIILSSHMLRVLFNN